MSTTAEFLRRLAAAAADQTLPRFRSSGAVSNKLSVGFDPVTEADHEAERAIRALIAQDYPDHGILGEEFGGQNIESEHLWIIDPIDGTRAFISGIPLWGTLVGLTRHGDAIAGMMAQPFTRELFYTVGDGAWYEGQGGHRRLATSETRALADAILFTTTPALFKDDTRPRYDALERQVRLARYGTDCYAFAMLAAGHCDLIAEPGLQTYDIAALIPIIEQAGGIVTTFDGRPAEQGGDILAAATPELHEAARQVLAGI